MNKKYLIQKDWQSPVYDMFYVYTDYAIKTLLVYQNLPEFILISFLFWILLQLLEGWLLITSGFNFAFLVFVDIFWHMIYIFYIYICLLWTLYKVIISLSEMFFDGSVWNLHNTRFQDKLLPFTPDSATNFFSTDQY